MKFYVKTFGCQQNKADSERITAVYSDRGMTLTESYEDANYVIVNTCMIRRSAEDRVYGLIENLREIKKTKLLKKEVYKIIVTGCMVGLAFRDKTGHYLNTIRARMPDVDEFLPIEEIGFDNEPVRQNTNHAWVPISNGCNNFCTFCVVPFTRGREISRPFETIIRECQNLITKGYESVMLLGQNVNSYGTDLLIGEKNVQQIRDISKKYFDVKNIQLPTLIKDKKAVYVKHLGRYRIPTLFPYLLEEVAKLGFKKVEFMSSNPWDFSDELIDVIAKQKNISRTIHLPVQSGDSKVLKRMNRWYTREQYLDIVKKLKEKVPEIKLTTDIIVGFCGETEKEFNNTLKLVKEVAFERAYISIYSQRPMTAASKTLIDNVPHATKKKRWETLERVINLPYLKSHHISSQRKN